MPAKSKPQGAEAWLNQVADGTLTMSQRSLSSIEKLGGLPSVRKLARARRVHLVLLTDDKGKQLIAASKSPFEIIC